MCSGNSTWKIVDVTPVHQEMPIFWITKRGQVTGEGHAGPDVPPEAAYGQKQKGDWSLAGRKKQQQSYSNL